MLEYIRGKLTGSTPEKAVLEVGGLGYQLFIPFSTYTKLPQMGQELLLYISTVIREDSQRRYGFLAQSERDLFEEFIQISGIGPKTALALIGHMELADLQQAISQKNVTTLCRIPGIGKKTAERLVVELKDRMQKLGLVGSVSAPKGQKTSTLEDAVAALIHLGYPLPRAQRAIKTVLDNSSGEPDLSKLITLALRHI